MSTIGRRLPGAGAVSTAIGAGRVLLGVAFFASPTAAVRVLGVDSASAKRMAFLARMTAARDVGLGIGTLASRGRPQARLWLAVGAAADGVDAFVIAAATKNGLTRGPAAYGTVLGAAAAAALGGWAAGAAGQRVRSRG